MITIHVEPGRSVKHLLGEVKPHGGHVTATDHGVTVTDEVAAAWLASIVEPVRKTTKKSTKKPKKQTETPEGGEN